MNNQIGMETGASMAGEHGGRRRSHRAWAVLLASFGIAGCLGDEAEVSVVPVDEEVAPAGEEVMRDSLGSALGPVSAALARANARADVELNLLARIEVQRDELLEIYEPTPGTIMVAGAGAPATMIMVAGAGAPAGKAILSREVMDGMAIADVWRLAAGSTAMPLELRAALARAERLEPDEQTSAPDGAGSASGGSLDGAPPVAPGSVAPLAAGWCDSGYYTSGYGNCPASTFRDCVDNWWNGRWAYYYGSFYTYTNVCPANGSVTLRVTSNFNGGLWTVPQNTVRWWYFNALFPNLNVRADVEQASGNRFHFRFLVLR
jgi:hypothetical protein